MFDGVAFSQGSYEAMIRSIGNTCCVICRVQINQWMGRKSVSLLVMDIHDGDYNIDKNLKCVFNSHYITDSGFALERNMLAMMYKQLMSYGESFKFNDLYRVRENLRRMGFCCTWYEIRSGLNVFVELGLIERKDKQNFKIIQQSGKTNLAASTVYLKAQVEG